MRFGFSPPKQTPGPGTGHIISVFYFKQYFTSPFPNSDVISSEPPGFIYSLWLLNIPPALLTLKLSVELTSWPRDNAKGISSLQINLRIHPLPAFLFVLCHQSIHMLSLPSFILSSFPVLVFFILPISLYCWMLLFFSLLHIYLFSFLLSLSKYFSHLPNCLISSSYLLSWLSSFQPIFSCSVIHLLWLSFSTALMFSEHFPRNNSDIFQVFEPRCCPL